MPELVREKCAIPNKNVIQGMDLVYSQITLPPEGFLSNNKRMAKRIERLPGPYVTAIISKNNSSFSQQSQIVK